MRIDEFLIKVYISFRSTNRHDSQDWNRHVAYKCIVSHVRVDVHLISMSVEIDAVSKSPSVIIDVGSEQVGIDSLRFCHWNGKQELDFCASSHFEFQLFTVISVNKVDGRVTLPQ